MRPLGGESVSRSAPQRPKHPSLSIYHLLVICILLAFPSTTSTTADSTTYSSACPSLAPAAARHTNADDARSLAGSFQIYNGHFSSAATEDGIFSFHDDPLHKNYHAFSLFPDRAARTSDPSLVHLAATLELADLRRRSSRGRNFTTSGYVSFALDGYYSSASLQLCMVGTSTATTGTDVVVLRLRVPSPPRLADPFVTGTLEGSSELGAIQLLAYAQGEDYEYGDSGRAATCSPPAAPPIQALGVGGDFPECAHLIDQLVTSYRLVAQNHHQNSGGALARLPLRMHVNQMRCTADGAVRTYVVFSNDTEMCAYDGFMLGEEAAVAEGRWDSARGMLCLTACRVMRSAILPSTLAVGECGIGMSFWFRSVWTLRDRSVVAGMLWNTSTGAGPISRVSVMSAFSMGEPAGYHRRNLSDVRYEYNDSMLEEAKKHYLAIRKENKIRGSFPVPGNYDTYHDFSFRFFGSNATGRGDPVSIGSVMMSEDALAAATGDSFSRHAVGGGQLVSVSYDIHHDGLLDHRVPPAKNVSSSSHSLRFKRQKIKAEGVYDPESGILCMVGCREHNGSTDCRVLVTMQLASMDGKGHGGGRGVVSSLRDRADRLFFEKKEIHLYGMYSQQLSEAVSRMDMESVVLVASATLSCVFAAAQILHAKRNPEAAAATSATMLAVLAMGYLAPLALSFEVMFASRRSRYGLSYSAGNGWTELNLVMVNVPALIAFGLHLRLLQLVVSGRGRPAADQSKPVVTTSERTVLQICLPLYLVGALLAAVVHAIKIRAENEMGLRVVRVGDLPATLRQDLVSYMGLIVDGFLLPQVILNASSSGGCCCSGAVRAISPWFYMGGTMIRVMPRVYDVVRRQMYEQSMRSSEVFASPRGDLFGVAWDAVVPCAAASLALMLFWQQWTGVGGAGWFLRWQNRRSRGYQMVPHI